MLRWHSEKKPQRPSASPRGLRLSSLLTILLTATFTHAGITPESVGGTSATEADLLWKDARAAYDSGDFEGATYRLERFVARYPGLPHYQESRLLLGKALVQAGRDALAIEPLKAYAASKPATSPDGREARIWLSRAHLKADKFNEAYLDAIEVENSLGKKPDPALAEALLVKSRALIGLGHDLRAARALVSARKLLGDRRPFQAEAFTIELTLKTRECGRLPGKGRLSEDQVLDQLDRRGTCLLGALLPFRSALQAGERRPAEEAAVELDRSFEKFVSACENPSPPPPIHPTDRDGKQLRRYKAELVRILRRECASKLKDAVELLRGWDDRAAPFSPTVSESFVEVLGRLKRLAAAEAKVL